MIIRSDSAEPRGPVTAPARGPASSVARGPASAARPANTRGPASAVLEAMSEGAATRFAIAARAGLPEATVEAVLEQLERLGQVRTSVISSGCPTGSCGTCPVAAAGPAPCQDSTGPGRGLRVLELGMPGMAGGR